MQVSVLPLVLLAGTVSLFGVASNTDVMRNHFPDSVLSHRIFQYDQVTDDNPYIDTDIVNVDYVDSVSVLEQGIFSSNELNKKVSITSSNEKILPRISSLMLPNTIKAGNSFLGWGNSSYQQSLVGIDGTGGTQPSPNRGIDGTGGTQPSPNRGIDGTGGTQPNSGTSDLDFDFDGLPIIALGTLERVGTTFRVNGVTFESSSHTKTIVNGEEKPDTSALANGQVIRIIGLSNDDNRGVVDKFVYTTQVTGVIETIDSESMTVLGQRIVFDGTTVFDGLVTTFSTLEVGHYVNVSGFKLSNGDLSATRIEVVESDIDDKLTGTISEHNEEDKTFTINSLTINYEQVDTESLRNGLTVNVQGVREAQAGSLFLSDYIEVVQILDGEAKKVEIEGFITDIDHINDSIFTVGDTPISFDYETTFDNQTDYRGLDKKDLQLDVKVEVEAEVDPVTGLLTAKNIIFNTANISSHEYQPLINHARYPTSATETFEWVDVNATAYRLRIYQGGSDVFYDKTFDGQTTSTTVSGLPETDAWFTVEFSTLHGEIWSRKVYSHYGAGTAPSAELTSHEFGDSLTSETETFTWNAVPQAEAYRIRVYNYPSQIIYHDEIFTEPEAVTVENLPTNEADVTITIYTLHNGWWSTNTYDVKSVKLKDNAVLLSHVDKQPLTGSTQTFTWSDVGAEEYELRVARRSVNGWYSILELLTFDTSTTSATIHNLPLNSGEVLIRLRTKHSGWGTSSYTFLGTGLIPEAELTSHADREVLTEESEIFTWTEVPEAEAYQLIVRSAVDYSDIKFIEDFNPLVTSARINNLPRNAGVMDFRLSTKHNGYWAHKYYKLNGSGELPEAKLTSHTYYHQIISSSSTTVTWNDVGADSYRITATNYSTDTRVKLHDQIYPAGTTSAVIDNLPDNSDVRISVLTNYGGWWAPNGEIFRTEFD